MSTKRLHYGNKSDFNKDVLKFGYSANKLKLKRNRFEGNELSVMKQCKTSGMFSLILERIESEIHNTEKINLSFKNR